VSAAYALRRAKLPSGFRWMGGSIIETNENGRTVAHGILTNDPRGREPRCFSAVACEEPEEVDNAILAAIAMIEAEAGL